MHVHLITIKVSIVGSGDTKIESEGRKRENFDSVSHQRHFVKRRLSIENDIVIIFKMSLYFVARLDMLIRAIP